jgi:hypothetical protein
VLVPGQGMADQDRVRSVGIERPVGLVGDLPGRQRDARIHHQRLVRTEVRHKARRFVDLASRLGRQGGR